MGGFPNHDRVSDPAHVEPPADGPQRGEDAETEQDGATTEEGERRGMPGPTTGEALRGLAQTTSEVVQKAASILEEEIAAGILAAKQVEQRFLNVQELRERDGERVTPRFRRDAHEVVDIFIDLVESGMQSLGGLARRVVTIRPGNRRKAPTAQGNIPNIRSSGPVRAGETVEVKIVLDNESDGEIEEFRFQSSDLVSAASGERIASECVVFRPSQVVIPPNGSAEVTVSVAVPAATPPGLYSGLIQATRMDQLRAVLTIEVE